MSVTQVLHCQPTKPASGTARFLKEKQNTQQSFTQKNSFSNIFALYQENSIKGSIMSPINKVSKFLIVFLTALASIFTPIKAIAENLKPREASPPYLDLAPLSLGHPEVLKKPLRIVIPRSPISNAPYKGPERLEHVLVAKDGDTLTKILLKVAISPAETTRAIQALKRLFDPKLVRLGQKIRVFFQPHSSEEASKKKAWAIFLGFG